MFSNVWPVRGSQKELESFGETRKPRVLIGVPGFAGVVPEAQEQFFQMAYRLGKDCTDYDFFLRIIIKREQFRARNTLVDLAIANDCDYLLMLDDDMVVPPDLFKKLVSHDKDVVGALYFQRGGAFHPVIMKSFSKGDGLRAVNFINHFDPILLNPGLHKLDHGVIGGGCMLFKMRVFDKIEQPYFWIDGIVGTDVHICDKLQKAGVDIWVDTSVELGHIGEPTTYTSRNIPQYGVKIGKVNEELWNDLKDCFLLNDEQIEQEIVRSAMGKSRKEVWSQKDRTTWEGVLDYYRTAGRWQVFNLAYFNLKFDQARDWAINEAPKLLPRGGSVADLGCGNGYVSVSLAHDGLNVTAIDLSDTPTLKFTKWRKEHKKLDNLRIVEQTEYIPPDLDEPVDMICMISVWDHVFDGPEMLRWINRNIKVGGFLICDSWRGRTKEDEPQHINAMRPEVFLRKLKAMGFMETPENPFLFKKEK